MTPYLRIANKVLEWREKSDNPDLIQMEQDLVELGIEMNRLEQLEPMVLSSSPEYRVDKMNLRNDIVKIIWGLNI